MLIKEIVGNPLFSRVIEPVAPVSNYGLEGSPEWNYFQQQVADFRAGRSAYRGQRTKEGSSTFNLSDEKYKKASNEYYEGLLNQINANRDQGIGEFALSTRKGRDDPSLINYNPNRTKAYTFGRDGAMSEIGSDRLSDYPDVEKETTANITAAGDELARKFSPGASALANAAFKGQGGLGGVFGKALGSNALSKVLRIIR
jgi:hypothetical protein